MGVTRFTGTVVINDDTEVGDVWAVGERLTLERPHHSGDEAVVEGFVFPGLVDVHCHVGLDSAGAASAELTEKQAAADRDSGVLLIRDAGSPQDTSWVGEREDLPRLRRAGQFIARDKRYLRGYARELEDVNELPRVAAEEARAGDGWVKIIADWIDRSLGEEGDLAPLWPDDVLSAAIDAAHAEGARVTAHTFATEAVDGLLDGGIDGIEHGTGMTDSQIEVAAERGIPVTPTLMQIDQFQAFATQAEHKYPRFARRMRRMHGNRYQQVRAFYEAGVQLLVGTDAGGTISHGSIATEAAEIVTAGVPDAAVVAAASWQARSFLGVPGIDEGASADLVVFDDDPRHDIRVLGAPRAIALRGRRFDPRP